MPVFPVLMFVPSYHRSSCILLTQIGSPTSRLISSGCLATNLYPAMCVWLNNSCRLAVCLAIRARMERINRSIHPCLRCSWFSFSALSRWRTFWPLGFLRFVQGGRSFWAFRESMLCCSEAWLPAGRNTKTSVSLEAAVWFFALSWSHILRVFDVSLFRKLVCYHHRWPFHRSFAFTWNTQWRKPWFHASEIFTAIVLIRVWPEIGQIGTAIHTCHAVIVN